MNGNFDEKLMLDPHVRPPSAVIPVIPAIPICRGRPRRTRRLKPSRNPLDGPRDFYRMVTGTLRSPVFTTRETRFSVAGTCPGRLRIGSEAPSGSDWVIVQSQVLPYPPALLNSQGCRVTAADKESSHIKWRAPRNE